MTLGPWVYLSPASHALHAGLLVKSVVKESNLPPPPHIFMALVLQTSVRNTTVNCRGWTRTISIAPSQGTWSANCLPGIILSVESRIRTDSLEGLSLPALPLAYLDSRHSAASDTQVFGVRLLSQLRYFIKQLTGRPASGPVAGKQFVQGFSQLLPVIHSGSGEIRTLSMLRFERGWSTNCLPSHQVPGEGFEPTLSTF